MLKFFNKEMENFKKRINIILEELNQNLIFQIEDGVNGNSYELILDNKRYFLKKYPFDEFNRHDRIKSELSFLNFLKNNNFKNVPEIIFFSKKDRWILYKWIKGSKIKKVTKKDVKDLITFLINIQNFRNKENLSKLPMASEACFSLKDHQKLITDKLRKTLKNINFHNNKDKNLKDLIENDFLEKIKISENIHKEYFIYKNFWDYQLSFDEICISPSDVGFHNILKHTNKLIFFDFEFSGIDDPCKLIVDLMIQPDHSVPKNYIYLIREFIEIFDKKIPFFKPRLKAIFDLYKLKWYCIIFNPLIKGKLSSDTKTLQKTFNKSRKYFMKVERNKAEILMYLK